MSISALARIVGVSPSHIARVELGQTDISLRVLEAIAKAFDLPVIFAGLAAS